VVLASGVLAWRPSLFAQDRVYDPYGGSASEAGWQEVDAYVSVVDGSARLERAGDVVTDFEQVPLEAGDAVRTARGRVEVLFSDGSVIALDEYTDITIDEAYAWRLHGGRMKVTWRAGSFEVDGAPAGVARLRSGGEYRITLADSRRGERELEIAVTRGSADLENALGRTQVRAGTRALTTASYAPSVPYAFSAPRDNFERWTESLESDRYGVESVRYLPVELRYYGGEFDRHGYWSHHASYGWIWYPRVSVGWEPYRSGRWTFIVNFGYSWVGDSRWAWPTHHYGRWDRAGARWFWVPSRPPQPRRVGFAVPRTSYSAPASYYNRVQQVRPVRQVSPQRPQVNQQRPQVNQQRPQVNQQRPQVQQPRAVPRGSQVPQGRQVLPERSQPRPIVREPEPRAQQRSRQPEAVRPPAPQRSRQPEAARPAPPQRSRQAPTPRASEPPRNTPQRAGSRTPSAGRAPSGNRAPSGSAVRRGGGR
jgi:hypothetical protein